MAVSEIGSPKTFGEGKYLSAAGDSTMLQEVSDHSRMRPGRPVPRAGNVIK